jgi:sn-glycerol 3-phosphate transport system ATP-binding protein
MRDEIQRLQRGLGLTMVYVTHDQTEAMSMADQVILLKDGKIVQVGTPAELYDKPATDFAAQFLGTPPMNVLPVADLDDKVPLPGGGHYAGIRPERVVVGDSGLTVEVSAVDYMGAETVLRLRHRDNTIMARVAGRTDAVAGDQLRITWNPDDVHLFDQAGSRL